MQDGLGGGSTAVKSGSGRTSQLLLPQSVAAQHMGDVDGHVKRDSNQGLQKLL
jgi:hypothetical protein